MILRGRGLFAIGAVAALACGALVTAAPASASASRITVKRCNQAALRSAIDKVAPGGRIGFSCDGTITLTAAGGSTIEIQKSLTLDGSGHDVTISGGGQVSLFFASFLATFTLKHLTLADGSSQDFGLPGGGAVFNANANLVTDDVTFRDNHAFNYGGAIYNFGTYASASISNSRFIDNVVTCSVTGQGGGAIGINAGGPTTVQGSSFSHNQSTGTASGGAIDAIRTYNSTLAGPLTVANSTFDGNATTTTQLDPHGNPQGGGAIAVFNHPLTVTGSSFTDNTVATSIGASEGGAVLIWGDPDPNSPLPLQPAKVSQSSFVGNLAQHYSYYGFDFGYGVGGAVAVHGARATLFQDEFRDNAAAQGGAVANLGTLKLAASTLTDNYASGFNQAPPLAGGLFSEGTATLNADVFSDNRAVNCSFPQGTVVATNVADIPDHTCRSTSPSS